MIYTSKTSFTIELGIQLVQIFFKKNYLSIYFKNFSYEKNF